MLFKSPDEFHDAPRHAVTVFGMAGVGKTRLAALLRQSQWFHYSVDYRIGTRHMGEFITDNFKTEAMKLPFLRDLLRTDSIKLASNITFANLAPLSTYLGRPGESVKGRAAARRISPPPGAAPYRRDRGAAGSARASSPALTTSTATITSSPTPAAR